MLLVVVPSRGGHGNKQGPAEIHAGEAKPDPSGSTPPPPPPHPRLPQVLGLRASHSEMLSPETYLHIFFNSFIFSGFSWGSPEVVSSSTNSESFLSISKNASWFY